MGVGWVNLELICRVGLAERGSHPENAKGHGSAQCTQKEAKVKHETPIRLAPQGAGENSKKQSSEQACRIRTK
jgi:hypothetical protein